jgi:hypothetical protein
MSLAMTDRRADLPVQLDELGVDCTRGLNAGTTHLRLDLFE